MKYVFLPCTGFLIYFGYGVRNSVQKQRLLSSQVNIEATETKPDNDGPK